jgi:hypothetical protein
MQDAQGQLRRIWPFGANEVSVGRAEPDLSDRAPNSRAHLVSSPTVALRYKARKFVLGISRVRELETKVSEEVVWIGHTGMLAPALALGQLDPNPDAASDHPSTDSAAASPPDLCVALHSHWTATTFWRRICKSRRRIAGSSAMVSAMGAIPAAWRACRERGFVAGRVREQQRVGTVWRRSRWVPRAASGDLVDRRRAGAIVRSWRGRPDARRTKAKARASGPDRGAPA